MTAPTRKMSTTNLEQFLEYTKSIWTFSAERASKVGHPAPFPVELPYRLIQFYTFEEDIVLDPFMGSGQTAIAALKSGRRYEGYETEEKYICLAERRIKDFKNLEQAKSAQKTMPLLLEPTII